MKLRSILIGMALFLAGVFALWPAKKTPVVVNNGPAIPRIQKKIEINPSEKELVAIGFEAPTLPMVSTQADVAGIQKACELRNQKIAKLSLQEFMASIKKEKTKFSVDCLTIPVPLDLLQGLEKCQKKIKSRNCWFNALLYRARVIDEVSKGESNYASMNANLALQKFWSKFLLPDGDPGLSDLDAISRRLIELKPADPNSYKAYLQGFVRSHFEMLESNQTEPIDALIGDLRRAWPTDKNFEALEVLRLEQTGSEAALAAFLAEHPTSARGYYGSAQLMWRQGRRQTTMDLLNKAVALDPSDTLAAETLKKAKTAPEKSLIFSFEIEMQIDFSGLQSI